MYFGLLFFFHLEIRDRKERESERERERERERQRERVAERERVDRTEMMAAASSDAGELLNTSGNSSVPGKSHKPLELYVVRISPPCRVVWMYLLQVGVLLIQLLICSIFALCNYLPFLFCFCSIVAFEPLTVTCFASVISQHKLNFEKKSTLQNEINKI